MAPDRSYPRGDYPRPPVTVLVWLVAAMIAAFVLQLALLSPWLGASSGIPDNLRLTVRNIQQGELWTLVTHGFLHPTDNPLPIVFSLLFLTLIGRELEPQLGALRFSLLFAGALLAGAGCWLALHWQVGGSHVGPSAAILAMFMVLARLYENQRMSFMPFFLFSVTVRPLHLITGLVVSDTLLLLLYELPGAPVPFGLTPSAHLGGLAAGWVYFRFFHANNGWDRAPTLTLPAWLQRNRPPAAPPVPASAPRQPSSGDLRADLDRILDKISSQGLGSLTAQEKKTLAAAKDLLGKS